MALGEKLYLSRSAWKYLFDVLVENTEASQSIVDGCGDIVDNILHRCLFLSSGQVLGLFSQSLIRENVADCYGPAMSTGFSDLAVQLLEPRFRLGRDLMYTPH